MVSTSENTCGEKEGSKHGVTYRNNFSCKEDISVIFSSFFLCSTFSLSLVSYEPTQCILNPRPYPPLALMRERNAIDPLSPLLYYTEHFFTPLFKTVIDKHQTRLIKKKKKNTKLDFFPQYYDCHKSTITAMTA